MVLAQTDRERCTSALAQDLPQPLTLSLVRVANSLPMFLFAIPAVALVDIVNPRLFLIIG